MNQIKKMQTTIKLLEEYQVQYVYKRFMIFSYILDIPQVRIAPTYNLNSSIRIGFPFTKNSTSKFVLFGLYYRIVLISGQFATRFYFCEGT